MPQAHGYEVQLIPQGVEVMMSLERFRCGDDGLPPGRPELHITLTQRREIAAAVVAWKLPFSVICDDVPASLGEISAS